MSKNPRPSFRVSPGSRMASGATLFQLLYHGYTIQFEQGKARGKIKKFSALPYWGVIKAG